MVFKDRNSPPTHDEIGQYRPPDSKDDKNPAYQQQQKTAQQANKDDLSGIPGANKASHGAPGPFVDKDRTRGINETPAKSPLMLAAYGAGGLGIAYMLLKVLKKK
ncbi:hypothetical protein M3Y97_00610400 [Aphelenchoides bicaudatus]|nr:hypothetical protein M3Y97_00610400 [Aphelenchoides bicaudatus]